MLTAPKVIASTNVDLYGVQNAEHEKPVETRFIASGRLG